ncbi:hypothetical protein PDESU_06527 [Pontiella desulfatans]|uniref:Haem-binding uptake Tiki superfamily ChaN domain-containing protein n=1 Tax=Pontiella desulfatans TaxID=2750659 RepID=A0A6C2UCT6_PONDE|nr:hypothetical protein [Pontiella desulfatans]VGO17925.1 hypothetical protein PDESU_06527 [Pontiella desulfatans]
MKRFESGFMVIVAMACWGRVDVWAGPENVGSGTAHAAESNNGSASAAEDNLKPGPIDVNDLKDPDLEPYAAHLRESGKPPIQYVVEKFKHHDVVIVGESHEIREVCEFYADLMDPIYHQAGVRYFAMEVLKHKNTHLANQLVTGETYDEELVMNLFRDCVQPTWAFQEYMDILKAIWQVNRALPSGAEPFKVIGLDVDADISLYVRGQNPPELAANTEALENRDEFMADTLAREVIEKGGKALVQIGANHSFTHYRQPVIRDGQVVREWARFGYILHESYGEKIFQVVLHMTQLNSAGTKSRQTLGGLLNKVFAHNENRALGFDVYGSPFAHLRDRKSYYFAHQDTVVFSDMARGYVFLKPLRELHRMTWANGFVSEDNFERVMRFVTQRKFIKMGIKKGLIKEGQCDTPEGLDAYLKMLIEHN